MHCQSRRWCVKSRYKHWAEWWIAMDARFVLDIQWFSYVATAVCSVCSKQCPRQLLKDSGHPLEFPSKGLANWSEIDKLIILTPSLWVKVQNMPWFSWILCLVYLKFPIAKKTRPPSLDYYAVLCLITQSCPTPCDPMDCSLPGSSVHGNLQARILEMLPCPPPGHFPNPGIDVVLSNWSFCEHICSSQLRNLTQLSHIAGGIWAIWATG